MLLGMIRQIKASIGQFRCVFVVFLKEEHVLGVGRLVVYLFRRSITFCKECMLYSRCYKLIEFLSSRGSGADTIVNVATVEVRFRAVALIEKLVFNVAYEKIGVAGSHFGTGFSLKSEEMCEFFDKRGYPASVVKAGHHRAQQIDRQSALETSQKENNNRIPFTLTFHPHNHAVKSIILKL